MAERVAQCDAPLKKKERNSAGGGLFTPSCRGGSVFQVMAATDRWLNNEVPALSTVEKRPVNSR